MLRTRKENEGKVNKLEREYLEKCKKGEKKWWDEMARVSISPCVNNEKRNETVRTLANGSNEARSSHFQCLKSFNLRKRGRTDILENFSFKTEYKNNFFLKQNV